MVTYVERKKVPKFLYCEKEHSITEKLAEKLIVWDEKGSGKWDLKLTKTQILVKMELLRFLAKLEASKQFLYFLENLNLKNAEKTRIQRSRVRNVLLRNGYQKIKRRFF